MSRDRECTRGDLCAMCEAECPHTLGSKKYDAVCITEALAAPVDPDEDLVDEDEQDVADIHAFTAEDLDEEDEEDA